MNFVVKIKEIINNPKRDFQDRIFVLLTSMAQISVFLVFIGDILLNENIVEIITLGGMLVASPIVSIICIKKNKTALGAKFIAIVSTFVILPVVFFFGGGLYGGAPIWFSFAFLYIGLMLTGKWRYMMLVMISVVAAVEYSVGYFCPYLIAPHSTEMFFMDSAVSVMIVGLVIYIMVWFQNRLFIAENNRAKEQTEKVEEMNEAQNRFFSNMSHEIRTPINTIIGLNEMILREDISDEVAEDAANVRSAGKMLLNLINDILDMSKLGSGQMKLTAVNYKPGDMLSELVGMLWIKAREKNLEFRINVAPDLPSELCGDEVRIKQILINVVNNAIKYTKEGTVSLSIQCGRREGNDLSVIYSVSDTGIGIKKEDIPYLFTAFRRADETTNRHIEGTGLGLSIVKQLTDLMGGNITVNSVYTKGTTFNIEIPQQVVNDIGIGTIDVGQNHGFNKKINYKQSFEAPDAHILVVDDNASNLLVVNKLLRETKVKIDTATSGSEALKKTLANDYHVIFMDHLMPEMDGLECHRRIRSQIGGRCREAKVVALTANAGGESKALYESEGFDGYLTKPISGDELERELCRLLPSDIVYMSGNGEEILEETISWMRSDQKKRNIIVTTDSVADLPPELAEKYAIAVLPHMIRTTEGIFKDGMEIDTDGLLGYMREASNKVVTVAPSVREHEAFFAKQLTVANNVIHVSISSKVNGSGCPAALEAAKAFNNVTVIDSGHLSSGQGITAIEAAKLAAEGRTVAEIISGIERLKSRVNTSFVVDNLDFLARADLVSTRIADITKTFMVRPVLMLKNGNMGIGKVFFGSREGTWKKYIDRTLAHPDIIDNDLLFITYVGLTNRELEIIKEMAQNRMKFKNVYFKKASPAIAVDCGAGTFGLLFKYKKK